MSAAPEVAVIATGTANIASVCAAFTRLGARATTTTEPEVVANAPFVVLPGVGAFGAAMAALRAHDLVDPLRARLAADLPLLCVCLGQQLLAASSEESPGVAGLGVIPARIVRFASHLRVPQLGWNTIELPKSEPTSGPRMLRADAFSFANSYCLRTAPPGWRVATADHGGTFVAAMERGRTLACQFHPELSGAAGKTLLRTWLEGGAA